MWGMNKKLGATLAALLAAATLTACGADEPAALTPDQTFLTDYHATFTTAPRDAAADQRAIKAAKQTCDALDNGATVEQVAHVAMDNGLSPAVAGDFVGMSVKTYCPKHFKD